MFFGNQPISFWIVIATYAGLLGGVSFFFVRYIKNTDDFYRASRHTPWYISGLSYMVSAFSAGVFVANASLAYNHGGVNIALVITQLSIFVFGYLIFSRKWHRTGVKSAIEFIEKRYDRRTAKFFVWVGIPMRILDNANRVYVTSVLLEALFGTRLWVSIVLTASVALAYTIFGGFIGLVVMDSLQAIMLGIIVLVMSVIAYNHVGGWESFLQKLPQGYWDLNPQNSDWGMAFVIAWIFVGVFAWNGSWSLVQRYVSVETESDAKKVSIMGGISYMFLFSLLALPPMFAAAIIPGMHGTQQAEQCYIKLAQMLLPAGLLGFLFFAIFGATITALSSELNVISQVVVQDMLKKVVAKKSERTKLLIGRVVVILTMACCMFISLGIRSVGGSLKYLLLILGLTSLPTFIPMLMGLVYRKTPAWGSMLSFCTGIGVSIILVVGFKIRMPYVILVNFVVTTATMLITGHFWPVSGEKKAEVNNLFERLTTPNSGDPETKIVAPVRGAMLPLISVALAIMGIVILLTSTLTTGQAGYSVAGVVCSIMFFAAAGILIFINRVILKMIKTAKQTVAQPTQPVGS